MTWHEVADRKLDYSQPGQLGAIMLFACNGGTGAASAATAGYDMGDTVSIAGESCKVTGLKVSTRDGVDYVEITASTPDYSWTFIPGLDDQDPEDDPDRNGTWALRFGNKLVPGNQVEPTVSGGAPAEPIPPEVLMPQPVINLEWRKTVTKPLPTTKADALDMAATYSAFNGGGGTFEANAPKVGFTLNGAGEFLCMGVEVEQHPVKPTWTRRIATYEFNPAGWDVGLYPAGAEADPAPPEE